MESATRVSGKRYTKTLEDQHMAAIEALPDLIQPSREAQLAIKTGTGEEILLESCFEGAHARNDTYGSGKQNLDNVQEMALSVNDGGTGWTVDPKVEGSRAPSGKPLLMSGD
jgi:hypothetical protein